MSERKFDKPQVSSEKIAPQETEKNKEQVVAEAKAHLEGLQKFHQERESKGQDYDFEASILDIGSLEDEDLEMWHNVMNLDPERTIAFESSDEYKEYNGRLTALGENRADRPRGVFFSLIGTYLLTARMFFSKWTEEQIKKYKETLMDED